MNMKKLDQIIGEGVGHASMCWNPRPNGVFDSTEASKVVDTMRQQIIECVKDSQPKGLTVEKIQSCVYDWLYNPEIDVWNKNDHKKLVQTIHAAQEGKGKK